MTYFWIIYSLYRVYTRNEKKCESKRCISKANLLSPWTTLTFGTIYFGHVSWLSFKN